MLDPAAPAGSVYILAQAVEEGAAIALIEGGGLLAALAGLVLILVRGTGLPREARMVLAGVLLVALATHFWAVVEWSTTLEMDQYVDLARVVTPILWMFFVYAISNELLRDRLKREEGRRTMMMRELDHRVKNNLTSVIAMAEQTLAWSSDLEGFKRSFLGRMRALGRAHEALAAARWEGVDLEKIVRMTLAPFQGPEEGKTPAAEGEADASSGPERSNGRRIQIHGDPVTLPARTSGAVCMALHELVTNAAKYGSLSVPQGRVQVDWEVRTAGEARAAAAGDGGGCVCLRWIEGGGPPVREGDHGLGLALIKGIVEYELGGRVALDLEPEGVRCVLEVPLEGAGDDFAALA